MKQIKLFLGLMGMLWSNKAALGIAAALMQNHHITEFARHNLLEIQRHWRFHQRNLAIIEYLLHTIFEIPESKLIELDLDSKIHLLEQKLTLFQLKDDHRLRNWSWNDFEIPAILSHDALENIFSQSVSQNLPLLELLLQELFQYSPTELSQTSLDLKQLNWQMFQQQLRAIYQIIYPDPNPKQLTAAEEKLFQQTIKSPNFAQITLKEEQQQKGATCGTHSIANAWAIEQLINEGRTINATNITDKVHDIITHCATDDLVEPEIILNKAEMMIPNPRERKEFLSRINFLNYDAASRSYTVQYLVDQAILQYLPRWFMPQVNLRQMAPQIKALMTISPHITHFICNTGYGHWFLISMIEKADHFYQLIYIDSATNELSDGRKRLIIALFNSF